MLNPALSEHLRTYLYDRGNVRGQVKHHTFLVLGHANTLYRFLHVQREASFEDLPEVADVEDGRVTIKVVCREVLRKP